MLKETTTKIITQNPHFLPPFDTCKHCSRLRNHREFPFSLISIYRQACCLTGGPKNTTLIIEDMEKKFRSDSLMNDDDHDIKFALKS